MVNPWYDEKTTRDMVKDITTHIEMLTEKVLDGEMVQGDYRFTTGVIQALQKVLQFVEDRKDI